MRNWERRQEGVLGEDGMDQIELGCTDEENNAAVRPDQGGCRRQDRLEALDGTQRDHFEAGSRHGFGAGGAYIDSCQYKSADDFAEKRGPLVIGFDEGDGEFRDAEFDGNAGKTGAGAYVGQGHGRGCGCRAWPGRTAESGCLYLTGKDVTRGEEAFTEVAGYDLVGIADCGQVHAGVPAQKYIDVYRYMSEKMRRVAYPHEWGQQFGDAGLVHRPRL